MVSKEFNAATKSIDSGQPMRTWKADLGLNIGLLSVLFYSTTKT